jgi:hypothetical protein
MSGLDLIVIRVDFDSDGIPINPVPDRLTQYSNNKFKLQATFDTVATAFTAEINGQRPDSDLTFDGQLMVKKLVDDEFVYEYVFDDWWTFVDGVLSITIQLIDENGVEFSQNTVSLNVDPTITSFPQPAPPEPDFITSNNTAHASFFTNADAELKVDEELSTNYTEAVSLESDDKFYVEKANGDKKYVTFQTQFEEVQGDFKGTFNRATGVDCGLLDIGTPESPGADFFEDLICTYPNGIADPETRRGWRANVLATVTLWSWIIDLNLWQDTGSSATQANEIGVNNAGNTLLGNDVQENINELDLKAETNKAKDVVQDERLDDAESDITDLQNDKFDKAGGTVTGATTFVGQVTFQGTPHAVESAEVFITDPVRVINDGEVGAGVTNGFAGVEVDRGTETNFEYGFDEVTDKFSAGTIGNRKDMATEEYVNSRKFIDASDTPASYPAGTKGYNVTVSDTEDRVEFSIPNNNTSTAVVSGMVITQASSTEINISSGRYAVIDYADPLVPMTETIDFVGASNVPVPTIPTGDVTYVSINVSGQIQFRLTELTASQRRQEASLGVVSHPDNVNIFSVEPQVVANNQPINTAFDMHDRLLYKDGLQYGGNASQSFFKNAGSLTGQGINWEVDQLSPNVRDYPAENPTPHVVVFRDGAGGVSFQPSSGPLHLFNNSLYDDGTGTLASIPAPTPYANHRIYSAGSGTTFVLMAQNVYSSLQDAVDARTDGSDIILDIPLDILKLAVLRSVFTSLRTSTDFSDTVNNVFFEVTGGGNVGGAVANVNDTNVNMTSALPNFGNPTNLNAFSVNVDANAEKKSNKTSIIIGNETNEEKYTTPKGVHDYVRDFHEFQQSLQPTITSSEFLPPVTQTNVNRTSGLVRVTGLTATNELTEAEVQSDIIDSTANHTGTPDNFTATVTNNFFTETPDIPLSTLGLSVGDKFIFAIDRIAYLSGAIDFSETMLPTGIGGNEVDTTISQKLGRQISEIGTVPVGATNYRFRLARTGASQAGTSVQYKEISVINLTKIYGAGNEPTESDAQITFSKFWLGETHTKVTVFNEDKNIVNPSNIVSGAVDGVTGEVAVSATRFVENELVRVKESTSYHFKSFQLVGGQIIQTVRIAYFDENKQLISIQAPTSNDITFTTPANTAFKRQDFRKADESIWTIEEVIGSKLHVERGTSAPAFEHYFGTTETIELTQNQYDTADIGWGAGGRTGYYIEDGYIGFQTAEWDNGKSISEIANGNADGVKNNQQDITKANSRIETLEDIVLPIQSNLTEYTFTSPVTINLSTIPIGLYNIKAIYTAGSSVVNDSISTTETDYVTDKIHAFQAPTPSIVEAGEIGVVNNGNLLVVGTSPIGANTQVNSKLNILSGSQHVIINEFIRGAVASDDIIRTEAKRDGLTMSFTDANYDIVITKL